MKRHILAVLLVVAASMGVATQASAQQYFEGARPTGMGGAYTAVGTGLSGMYHNPAGIAAARMYAIGGTYAYTPSGNLLNASVVDSKTNPKLAAEVGYSYLIPHEQADPGGHDIRAAIAIPALPERVSLGISGRYLILDRNGTEFARGFTLDAGFLFQILETFHAGLVGKNFIDVCQQPARCRGAAPLTFGAGLAYGKTTPFHISADFAADLGSEADAVNYEVDAGAEYMIGGSFPIRAGYKYRTFDSSNRASLGFGWRESQFGLDVGANMDVADPSVFTVSTTASVYFN